MDVLCVYKTPKFSPLSVGQLEEKLHTFVAVEWAGLIILLQQGAIQSFVVAFSFPGHPSAGRQHHGACWQAASSTLGAPGRIKLCRLSLMGYHQYAQLVLWGSSSCPKGRAVCVLISLFLGVGLVLWDNCDHTVCPPKAVLAPKLQHKAATEVDLSQKCSRNPLKQRLL